MHAFRLLRLAAIPVVLCAVAVADDGAWHPTLEKGIDAAKKSGRPVFVLTTWPDRVCNLCDTWRSTVRGDATVLRRLGRFETVEWSYREKGVIRWTQDGGGTSEDPAAQCFVVGTDGRVRARLDDSRAYVPTAVAAWLREQADAWEAEHPRTTIPFRPAKTATTVEDTTRRTVCTQIDEAVAARRPVLVWVSRETTDDDRARRAEAAACRRAEAGLLASKSCAEAADGWTLVRLDLAEEDEAAVAAALGVDRAPALLAIEPGAERPVKIALTTSAADLAWRLRKSAPRAPEKSPAEKTPGDGSGK